METGRKAVAFFCAFLIAVFLMILWYPCPAHATSPTALAIRQTVTERVNGENTPLVFVFFECLKNERPFLPEDFGKFSAVLGGKEVPVSEAHSFNGGNGIVFLVDTSKSMNYKLFTVLKQGIGEWIDGMKNEDRAALMVFGTRTETLVDFTSNRQTLRDALNGIEQSSEKTALYQAIYDGLNAANRDDKRLPMRRTLVVFTDGVDDAIGGITSQVLEDTVKQISVPVYATLYPSSETLLSSGQTTDRMRGQFKNRVIESGGWINAWEGDRSTQLTEKIRELSNQIQNVVYMALDTSNIEGDGSLQNLQVTWSDSAGTVSAVKAISFNNVPPVPVSNEPSPDKLPRSSVKTSQSWPWPGIIVGAVVVLGLIVGLFVWSAKKKFSCEYTSTVQNGDYLSSQSPAPVTTRNSNLSSSAGGSEILLSSVSDNGGSLVYRRFFHDSIVIGRASSSDILTIQGDEHISSRHCEIFEENGRFRIRDLGSTNGTALNGAPLTRHLPINNGDVLTLGKMELRVAIFPARQDISNDGAPGAS
jgi:hypothetical protein